MANIKQVASLANLSVACVSKYLKDPNSVRLSSRQKIESAIAELKYTPSPIARSLRTKRTGLITVVSHSITNPFFAELFELLRKKLEEYNLISVLQVMGDKEPFEISSHYFEQSDGMIICFPENDEKLSYIKSVIPKGFPLVCINAQKTYEDFISIVSDVKDGLRLVTEYLISLGCKNLAYIGGPVQSTISVQKFKGFSETISQSPDKIFCTAVLRGTYELKTGYTVSQQLISNLPDAVICENDILAAGVIHRLIENGINIPERIHITGYDNIPLSEMIYPPLTTVDMCLEELSSATCEELNKLLNNHQASNRFFAPKLIIRES